MPTTTNYGWTTPADTDLVKDGASAIRTLGTAIDTTTKNLNPSTTLGDIEYRSSTANTNTRLAIGTTGQVLTVAGGVPSWATASAGGLTLLSTTSLSGSSTSISSISSSYKHLQVIVRGLYAASGQPTVRLRVNGDTGSNYAWIWFRGRSDSGVGVGASGSDTLAQLGDTDSSSNNDKLFNADIFIPRYSGSDKKQFFNQCSYYIPSLYYMSSGSISWNSTSAINELTFSLASSTFSGGTVYVYGME